MKVTDIVICINNNRQENTLTINKKYTIISKDKTNFTVGNDNNNIGSYLKTRFITLKEYEILHRLDKIKKIL